MNKPKEVRDTNLLCNGFTLAEVLITLGIIGVVAAVTIPTLVTNYQNKTWNTASQVFEKKLEEALKIMNTQQTLAGYRTTEDFVEQLQNNLKITKVCKNDDILSCFDDKVYWGADEEEVDMNDIKTSSHFGQEEWNTDLVGIQIANGTTGIIAYNPSCRQDPYSNQISGTSCIAILYDTTGFKGPNTQSKDLRSINVNRLGGNINCEIELSEGSCFSSPFNPPSLTIAECEAAKSLGIKNCFDNDDFWAGAVQQCGGVQNMPTASDLAKLANSVYTGSNIGETSSVSGLTYLSDSKVAGLFPKPSFSIWSDEEMTSRNDTYTRDFYSNSTNWVNAHRYHGGHMAICKMK